jgi:hypothetical protein
MFAAMDETTPNTPTGDFYVIAASVTLLNHAEARQALRQVLNSPKRVQPFHWYKEGPTNRNRMLDCLSEMGAVAHVCVHYPTHRKGHEAARARAIEQIVPLLIHDGVDELLIESRGDQTTDDRDKPPISNALQALGHPPFYYGWHKKTEPLLWAADAICGAMREMLLSTSDAYYKDLCARGIIGVPIRISS